MNTKAARAALLAAKDPYKHVKKVVSTTGRYADGGVAQLPERPDPVMYRLMDPDARDAWKSDRDWRKGASLRPGDPARDANFSKWFDGSKVVDRSGAPLRTYHASNKNITRFIPGGSFNDSEHASGPAIWLSPYPERQNAAHNIGGYEGNYKPGTNVTPLHVAMKNPLVIDHSAALEYAKSLLAGTPTGEFPLALSREQRNRLIEAGHDGIIYAGGRAANSPEPAYSKHAIGEHPDRDEELIVFDSNQLKSAIGNRGTYRKADQDIRYARGGDVWDRFHKAVAYARGGRAEIDDKLLGSLKRPGSGYVPVKNKPGTVKIPGYGEVEARPIDAIQKSAAKYMGGKHFDNDFSPFDEDFARKVALAFERMQHNPNDPKVKRAYDALIDETLAQYHAARDTGIDFKFIKPGESDPYAKSPSLGYADIVNNGKLHVFPTEAGFGSSDKDVRDNPLLKKVGRIGDLNDATVNDAFRIVHDLYGHYGPGNPFFRAPGEERAFVKHAQMYGPEARKAAASETRGQNSWVNYGPFGEKNRKATGADTVFADQKTGLMDDWAAEPYTKADGGAISPERRALINEHNELLKRIRPLAAKGGLSGSEARQFKQLTDRITDIKFDLAKPGHVDKVLPAAETMNAMHPEAVVAAHTDYHRSRPIHKAVSRAAAGVGFNQNTAVDDIMDGRNPEVTPQQFYANFQSTRDALRRHHGDVITLYRSEGRQMPKATKNWATTPEFASQFGGNVISQQVPVDNIVGANVMTNGKYHELIVGAPPKTGYKDGGSVITPEMMAPATEAPAMVRAAKAAARPEPEGEDHPAWIPTRLVTSKKAKSERSHIVDMKSLRDAPALYEKNIDLLRAYPNMRESTSKRQHKAVEQEMIRHVKENLLDLHDRVPEDIRNRSKLWYDGARRITDDWMKTYDLPDHSVAGALAALSPQKDWYQNVSLAKRVLDSMRGDPDAYQTKPFSTDMEDTWRSRPSLNKPVYEKLIDVMRGKSLGDFDKMDMSPAERATLKAMWIRMHDETHNDPAHPIITPEGTFGELVKTDKGENAKVGWGSLGEIAKAVRSVESANDPGALSQLMGERHKVRNFYNNIISPNSRHGDVTIDTHAVAAGLMRPLSGNSLEVAHNFANHPGVGLPAAGGSAITGAQGLYPLYAEAYRQAARERGIKPREMQSITWEAIRGLFPDTFKTKTNSAKIDAVWHNYRKGKISQAEARDRIHDIAGGIRNPTWVVGRDEANRGAADAGELSQPVVHGQSAQGADTGGGSGLAAAVPSLVRARGGKTQSKPRTVDPEQIARAKALGYDTDKVWYHSSLEPLEKFDAHGKFVGRSGTAGIHLTDSYEAANRYLDRFGDYRYDGKPFQKNVIPVFVKKGRVLERDEPFKSSVGMGMPVPANYTNPVTQQGYDSLLRNENISRRGATVGHGDFGGKSGLPHKELVLYDPTRVRSVFAQFNPEDADSAQLSKARGGSVNHAPTEAQKTAGNYAKRKMSFQGLPITIENELGSVRSGRDARGRAWSCKLPAAYGYVRGTEGADGDHVDVYVGPDGDSKLVVVVNQRHLDGDRGFDEHKSLLGFTSERDAIDCYVKAFSDGKGADRIKSVEVMSVDAFKKWLRHGKTTKPANGRSIVDRALQLTAKGAHP